MNVRCELNDYEERNESYFIPKLVITDAGFDNDMVEIHFGNETEGYKKVKVKGKEMIDAVQRCMNTSPIF